MTNKKISIGNVQINATEGLILTTLAFFSLLAIVFYYKIEDWWMLVLKNIVVAFAYILLNKLSVISGRKYPQFVLRITAVALVLIYLFSAVDKLQLLIHREWMDYYVLDFEQWIFNLQPTLLLEDYISKPLTEWMMFSYVIFIPVFPVFCGIVYYMCGEPAMEDCFFKLAFTCILCIIGFILFPVAGPMYCIKHLYTVPLEGWIWTSFGECLRSCMHSAGGSMPSPYTAAATIIWVTVYRYHRPSFWIMTPIVLSLYISTFYCRYHYVTDAVIGIITAFIALAIAPFLMKLWDKAAERNSKYLKKA
ncbi:MAG: phosphatase PAP2 family protein [Bacteroidetes bacterium]|nr:phosphatase PAP2 family protein [Bacteroidota bacterium]